MNPIITPNHSVILTVPVGAAQYEITFASRHHEKATRRFQKFQLIQQSLIQQALEAINSRYFKRLRNYTIRKTPTEVYTLLLNLFTVYGKITPQQLNVRR